MSRLTGSTCIVSTRNPERLRIPRDFQITEHSRSDTQLSERYELSAWLGRGSRSRFTNTDLKAVHSPIPSNNGRLTQNTAYLRFTWSVVLIRRSLPLLVN